MSMSNDVQNADLRFRFILRGNSIVLKNGELPDCAVLKKCLDCHAASDWFAERDLAYSALLLEDDSPDPAGCSHVPVRQFFWSMRVSEEGRMVCALAARAKALFHFRRSKRFCSVCGGVLKNDGSFTARTCARCGQVFFPQIEPAVIVLVTRNDELLLARHKEYAHSAWTTLAGFVECGETVENAVRREIKEETNICVKNIRYVASQSWPFPDQLMLAFRAEYDSGEIKIQKSEIAQACWFKRDSLPEIPPPGSVAYNLIHGIYG